MNSNALIYDTTLRDGQQGDKISFSVEDKIKIAKKLDELGVHYIEGGWPGANVKDTEFFKKMKSVKLKNAKLVAFGSTRHVDNTPEKDKVLNDLLKAGTDVVCIFGKTWDLHVKEIMGNTLEQNLEMIEDSVRYLKSKGKEIIYDAEHFFDGFVSDPLYAIQTIIAAIKGGADYIVLCDTNGGKLTCEIANIVTQLKIKLLVWTNKEVKLGIHAHNDTECAVANSMEAFRLGVKMIQGTINGYGERCGNANLISIILNLYFKMNTETIHGDQIQNLRKVSLQIAEIANVIPDKNQPYVGVSAFTHKGGIHGSAVAKNPKTYEHIDPSLVGNMRKIPATGQGGKSNIVQKAQELGIDIYDEEFNAGRIVDAIKEMERQGYQFDEADGSLKLVFDLHLDDFKPFFEIESWQVTVSKEKDSEPRSIATVEVSVNGEKEICASKGAGPVDAFDKALRKSLSGFFPEIGNTGLVDYKVRVINGAMATESFVRVLIESSNGDTSWNTIGVSPDVIAASAQAIEDSHHFILSQKY